MKKKVLLVLGTATLIAPLLGSCGGSGSDGYTLREYDASTPTNWNPHTWEMSNDTYIPGYCEIGFVDTTRDPETGGYKFVNEMASDVKDVTQADDYIGADFMKKWSITKGETGRVWEIDLNQDAKFQDGTVINADSYVESMKRCIDPQMRNYRATTYYTGDIAIQGASAYFYSDADNYHSVPDSADLIAGGSKRVDDKTYLNFATSYLLESSDWFGPNGSIASIQTGGDYAAYFTYKDASGKSVNVADKYPKAVELTADIQAELELTPVYTNYIKDETQIANFFGSYLLHDPAVAWDTVGLLKKDDNTLLYITAKTITDFYFKVNLSTTWLVDTKLYDSLKVKTGNLYTCTYGTSMDTYQAYGPYKLSSFEKDKQIKFVRNDNWYGWKDGKHTGQYQATNIQMDVIPDHASALLSFQKGELDSISLEPADVSKYGYSSQLLHTPETYTMRLVFNSNIDDLKTLETSAGDGANKEILAEYDFRKAISLCINRKDFNTQGTSGNESAYGLLNNLYYYDVENNPNSVYRKTDEAKKAIVDLYGLEYGTGKTYATLDDAYKAVTGLDVAKAKELFSSAYTQAIADGYYKDGQAIKLNIGYYDNTLATTIAQIKVLNEDVAAATVGTKLEGKITFAAQSYNGSTSRYTAMRQGLIEMANCAWGGAAFWPFSMADCYLGTNGYTYDEKRSWDPTAKSFSLTYDFDLNSATADTTETLSYADWENAIASNGKYGDRSTDAAMKRSLYILSRLEYNLLNLYNFAVVGSYGTASLYSYKISYATTTYNIMYGYGGIRYMTFNYTDAAWSSYVSSQGGQLKYE